MGIRLVSYRLIGEPSVVREGNCGDGRIGETMGNTDLWLVVKPPPKVEIAVDANRDGVIKLSSEDNTDKTDVDHPFKFWPNDDYDNGNSPVGGIGANYKNPVVDGTKDLEDFFPVFLNLKEAVKAMPPGNYTYKLKQANGALNFVYSKLSVNTAFTYKTGNPTSGFGDSFFSAPGSAAVHQITSDGYTLSEKFLNNVRDYNQGVILVEGRGNTTAPLVLEISRGGSIVAETRAYLSIHPRIILLLHGMNSNTAAWDPFVTDKIGSPVSTYSTDIFVERTTIDGIPAMTANGVRAYRLQFGGYESATTTRTGLEGVSTRTDPNYLARRSVRCGDFETFAQLGQEVDDAITLLLIRHPDAEIILLGHSRGGIAMRAFLQTPGSNARKSAVKGVLTTGSPHLGSPMGRIYTWLRTRPRPTPLDDDWQVVELLKEKLDVRRPVIGDLDNSSPAITSLNTSTAVSNLPAHIRYGEIVYAKVDLGFLDRIPIVGDYTVFDVAGPNPGQQLSSAAQTFILGTGNLPSAFPGDGLIPWQNQIFTHLPGFRGVGIPRLTNTTDEVLHIEEGARTEDLRRQLNILMPGWFP